MSTPYERTILTHYWISNEPLSLPDCSLLRNTIDGFVSIGLLIRDELGNITGNNEALRPYMEALDAVPYPTRKWVVEEPDPWK